jgi:hypothetical protein
MPEKLQSLARQTPIKTDGILGKQLEIAAVTPASFGGGIAAIDDGDAQTAITHRRSEMIRCRSTSQPCTDDQNIYE